MTILDHTSLTTQCKIFGHFITYSVVCIAIQNTVVGSNSEVNHVNQLILLHPVSTKVGHLPCQTSPLLSPTVLFGQVGIFPWAILCGDGDDIFLRIVCVEGYKLDLYLKFFYFFTFSDYSQEGKSLLFNALLYWCGECNGQPVKGR